MIKKKSKINSANKVKEKMAVYSAHTENNYAVIIEQDEDGFFVASVPSLPGCHTQAKTLPDLRKNVKDAIKLCLPVSAKDYQYQKAKSLVDKGIAEGLADVKAGRTYGPFETHKEMVDFLHESVKKYNKSKITRK